MRQARQTMREMMIGLGIWGIFILILLTAVSHRKAAMAAGVCAGILTAVWMLRHMLRHLDIALDQEQAHAQRHMRAASARRLAVMAVILAVSILEWRYVHPLGVAFGIFGMKVSAFLQPMVHRGWTRKASADSDV